MDRVALLLLLAGLLAAGCVGDGGGPARGRPRDAAFTPGGEGPARQGGRETLFVEPPPVSPNTHPHRP